MRELRITKSITNRDETLNKYLAEVNKTDLITPQQELELVRKMKEGCELSKEKLIKANLRFVISVAKQYQNLGLSLCDLISEGNIGLIKAINKFDDTRGFKIISYAVWWIRQSIFHALTEYSRTIKLPQNHVSTMSKINKTSSHLQQILEREPTTEELAEAIKDMSFEKINETMKNCVKSCSLDSPLTSDEGSGTLLDTISDIAISDYTVEELRKELKEIVFNTHKHDLRTRIIMELFYGLNGNKSLTLEEIGEELELSPERIRQLKEKAIRRIRWKSKEKTTLREYLPEEF